VGILNAGRRSRSRGAGVGPETAEDFAPDPPPPGEEEASALANLDSALPIGEFAPP
jgi:hypothetical protein